MGASEKMPMFPLIRHVSKRVTPVLLRLPVSANQITVASLATGLAASWCFAQGTHRLAVAGAIIFFVTYVLDHCDGEVARSRGETSTFGWWLDSLVDWIVHSAFFIALGISAMRNYGGEVWLWMGVIAALGCTINFLLAIYFGFRERRNTGKEPTEEPAPTPEGPSEWVLFAFRELSRADFCFIVLALALFDMAWVLVPAAAVGSQVYWIMIFFGAARRFRV